MISCDTNILFPACDCDHKQHIAAREFLSTHRSNHRFVLCEQVLAELYILLRNPGVSQPPLNPSEAVAMIHSFRSNPNWRIVDVPGHLRIMDSVWGHASRRHFAFRRIFDLRLAYTLSAHGVTSFATCNLKDFKNTDFEEVWNPLQ